MMPDMSLCSELGLASRKTLYAIFVMKCQIDEQMKGKKYDTDMCREEDPHP